MADTIVDPGTMVTHPEHTTLAQPAVVAARWLVALAFLTKTHRSALHGHRESVLQSAGQGNGLIGLISPSHRLRSLSGKVQAMDLPSA